MVGHKLGEFSPTRQFAGHTPADKKAAQTEAAEGSSASPNPTSGAQAAPAAKPKEAVKNAK